MTPMIKWNKLHTTVLAFSVAGLAVGCRSGTETTWNTPVYSGGTYATTDDLSVDQRRVDITNTDPGTPGGDRTSADPSETSTMGAGSRALVGEDKPPIAQDQLVETGQSPDIIVTIGPKARQQLKQETTQTEPLDDTAVGGAELDDADTTIADEGRSEMQLDDQAAAGDITTTNLVIPLHEESVQVGKRVVDAGTVTLRKTVRTETVNKPVQIRTETFSIDRQEASPQGGTAEDMDEQNLTQDQAAASQPFEEQEFTIQLKKEVPVVQKQVTTKGQFVARTQVQTVQTNIQSQVRTEEITVDDANAQLSHNLADTEQQTEPSKPEAAQQDQDESAVGSASEVTGRMTGAGSSAAQTTEPITELDTLTSADTLSTFAGRKVNLSNVEVKAVVGPQLISIGKADQEPILVRLQQPMKNLSAGSEINLTGTLKQSSEASTEGLTGEAAHVLSQSEIFLDAQSATPAGQQE